MPRRVFFSFHYDKDAWKVSQIRNCYALSVYDKPPFLDAAEWESVKRKGDAAIQSWIDTQMKNTSVTIVLVGAETHTRPWVKYEIQKSRERGNGMLAVKLTGMKDQYGQEDMSIVYDVFQGAGITKGTYPFYSWVQQNGRVNISAWIENAASAAGR